MDILEKILLNIFLKKSFEVHAIGLNRPKIKKNNKFFFIKKFIKRY